MQLFAVVFEKDIVSWSTAELGVLGSGQIFRDKQQESFHTFESYNHYMAS